MHDIQNPNELKTILEDKNLDYILLDVRTPEEFSEGHIQSAINMNISSLGAVNKITELDKSKTYIVYCRSGGRSNMASMIMQANGFSVINCKFGFMHLAGSEVVVSA